MSDKLDVSVIRGVSEAYAKTCERYDIMCCPTCFAVIKDDNGRPLQAEHKCDQLTRALLSEFKAVVRKYQPKMERDKIFWAVQKTNNRGVTDHVRRKCRRRATSTKAESAVAGEGENTLATPVSQ
jgi:hypothetical protein